MSRKPFDASRDQRVAEDYGDDRALLCNATGCPNRWTVSHGGSPGLCSAHAWADRHLWPQITSEQNDAQTERAYAMGGRGGDESPRRSVDKRAVIDRLRSLNFGQQAGREWAEKLRQREEAGERLTQAQKEAWRAALHVVGSDARTAA